MADGLEWILENTLVMEGWFHALSAMGLKDVFGEFYTPAALPTLEKLKLNNGEGWVCAPRQVWALSASFVLKEELSIVG